MNAALPVADVFGPPAAGMLADKIGNFRLVNGRIKIKKKKRQIASLKHSMGNLQNAPALSIVCTYDAKLW